MSRYLVVAHQTATSPELMEQARRIASEDREATFTLLIPATHPTHLLHGIPESRFVWDEERTYAIAERRARDARAHFERAGFQVDRTVIGDASPVLAIEDELRLRPGYDTIVLSTLPAGRSRWLLSGIGSQVAKFGIPVVHVGGQPAPPPRPSLLSRIPVPRALRELAGGGERATIVAIAALMLVYLTGSTILALRIDRGFFLNDAMALVAFSVIIGGLAYAARRGSPR